MSKHEYSRQCQVQREKCERESKGMTRCQLGTSSRKVLHRDGHMSKHIQEVAFARTERQAGQSKLPTTSDEHTGQ